MPTIRKRGKNYQVQIRRVGFPLITRTFSSKSDAEAWARQAESKVDRGDLPVSLKLLDRFTLRGIIERYRDEISSKKRSFKSEECVLNAFIRRDLCSRPLSRITTADFAVYRDERLKTVKPGTINSELSTIKHALDIAMNEWGVPLRSNPLSKIKKLKVQNARSRRLKPFEMRLLIGASEQTSNPFTMLMIRFALATAMRRGEITRLKWSEVDLSDRTLFIPIAKNGYSRTIPLSPEALTVLNEVKNLKEFDTRLVFPVSDNAVRLSWQRLVKRAGVIDLHFHDFRHEATSRFFERGLSIPEVALITGHKDPRMLFRYTHLNPKDVADKLHSPIK